VDQAAFVGKSTPLCLTRLEHNEHAFIESCNGDTDGVVVNLRFDSSQRIEGLRQAALKHRLPFLIDLESWRLPYLSGPEDDSFGSDARTPLAQAVPLPLSPEALEDSRRIEALVRTAASVQAGAMMFFAPYFQVRSVNDPWLSINLNCLREMRRLAPRQMLSAWVNVPLETMLSGALPFLAERYRSELPANTPLVLTVSDIRLGERTPQELAVYFSGIEAFRDQSLAPIVDRASEISIPAVGAGAAGCMLGNRIYRSAPSSPIWSNDFNPIIRLRYFDGERARKVSRDVAKARGEQGTLKCRYSVGCDAINASKRRNIELRLHAAHEMRDAARRASRLGSNELQNQWRNAELKELRGFAQALALAQERRKQA
jgi:hypothetical protein